MRTPIATLLAAIALAPACSGDDDVGEKPSSSPSAERELLPVEQRLIRASLSTRGIRPTVAELEAVAADPEALEAFVDAYLASPAFGDTIKAMHAEVFLTRTDADAQLPSLGIAEGYTTNQMHEATAEEPLELIRHIVENDLPYTEVVTADYMLANEVVADIYGIDVDPDVAGWRPAHWPDGRPHAGILSSSQLYRRHVSAGSNFHRLRANMLAETLLCESFAARDLAVDGGVDLTDEAEVAAAVRENPNCIGCHQALDPLAANLWGFKRQIDPRAVEEGTNANDCAIDPDRPQPPIDEGDLPTDYCYPLVMYTPAKEDRWVELGLRAPGYYGKPVDDLADLGAEMAADPRFAQCAVRRFYGWFSQQSPGDLPLALVQPLQDAFVGSNYNAKVLAKEILLSESFAAVRPVQRGDAPLLSIRPEALADTIADLTGFRWNIVPEPRNCAPTCWSEVELTTSDLWGFRSLAGGIDGFQVLRPTHTASPNKVLVTGRLAAEAAAFVVANDLAAPKADRKLLTEVESTTADEDAVRDQLLAMHTRVLGPAGATPLDIDEAYGLFEATRQQSNIPTAWTVVTAMLLQDPRLVFY